MVSSIFITATDTDAGKTYIASSLLHYLNTLGKKTLAFKPIASGCEQTPNGLRNPDAVQLADIASVKIPYSATNPFAFEAAIAPHLAAEKNKQTLTLAHVIDHYRALKHYAADYIVIEGAGGWRLPIQAKQYLSDFVKVENIPVILVVGLRLGCLNHTVLTYEALQKDGIKLLGWVANTVEAQMPAVAENIACLENLVDAPLLGVVPYSTSVDFKAAAAYIRFKSHMPF